MTTKVPHHVFLVPGMFGFARLAQYEYFGHVERALAARYREAGVPLHMEVVATPPTASIRRRAAVVARAIAKRSRGTDGPIHLVGHSTGGLDARLVCTPSLDLGLRGVDLSFRDRLRSVVTINTPHYGTPLAAFFATVSGTRLLYAISLLTVTTLTVGAPPLAAFSSIVAAVGGLDEALGIDIQLLDRTTDLILRFLGDRGRGEVRAWLDEMRGDQGGILQITPEAMDVFNASTANAPHVRYASLASAAPPPNPSRIMTSVRSPYAALSMTLYSTLYRIAGRAPERYPYAMPTESQLRMVGEAFGRPLDAQMNDGIVPTGSMLWGDLAWVGKGDHLDMVGHFRDDDAAGLHVDWLTSGAHFGRYRFRTMTDALANVLLEGEAFPDDEPAPPSGA